MEEIKAVLFEKAVLEFRDKCILKALLAYQDFDSNVEKKHYGY